MENFLKPRKVLNKAYLKVKPYRESIEKFKANLIQLIDRTNETESEEFHKNLVIDFLKKTYYDPEHFINTKGRNDLVIHNGKQAKTNVGVIIEAKKPTNKAEMLSKKQLNTKALQELLLYYLRERETQKNKDLRHLIVTNINEWFIFDAQLFEKQFYNNKSLIKEFNDFEAGRLSGKTTDFFYKEIAQPVIEKNLDQFSYTYFDLTQYEKPLRNDDKKDDNKLIVLFKLLSPEHLLKLPFANDSNSLDKKFYAELLHIIGLSETKQGGKKVIERKKEGGRDEGSLLENAITQLEAHDKIYRLEKPSQYGATNEERLFNVGLELVISWVNRILFLKLMEAQLINYHKGDKEYSFLNFKKVSNYDDLDSLFFQVLAKKFEDRKASTQEKFSKVPYLNSSLFEANDLEHNALFISNLRDELTLPILSNTVLKDGQGRKRKGELSTLEYLFAFLEAYDFSSEGAEEIQEEDKKLISASVLGLIFEKINGYKDGSFFTPGFITMYMCREAIRRAVVQKFNEIKGWDSKKFEELYDKIEDRTEANEIINSLKICDPAVGSGHFLVSALNEMISIKNDLKILQDRNGKRLKEYQFEIENDELIITDDDGDLFEYSINNKESQRVQETLFHEKQNIIENCLFGVDINPNSVKICRLRLWIELLKNAYYKNEIELETLPNIDINIKCGNSLVSRFDLDVDISDALKKSKWDIRTYREAVNNYKNASTKEDKRDFERLIGTIKNDFQTEISKKDKRVIKRSKLQGELFNLTNQQSIFEMGKKEKKIWEKDVEDKTKALKKLDKEIEEIKNNKIFENAFEWRFEFPEALNNEGDFIGFDTVIGNPPYIYRNMDMKLYKNYFKENYKSVQGNFDLYKFFMELILSISSDRSFLSFIVPNTFLSAESYFNLRKIIMENVEILELYDLGLDIFDGVVVENIVFLFQKPYKKNNKTLVKIQRDRKFNFDQNVNQYHIDLNDIFQKESSFNIYLNPIFQKLVNKIRQNTIELGEIAYCTVGINTGYIKDQMTSSSQLDSTYHKMLNGKDIGLNSVSWKGEWIKYDHDFIKSFGAQGRSLPPERIFKEPKILVQRTRRGMKRKLVCFYDENGYYNLNRLSNIVLENNDYNLKYIHALMNSKLMDFYFNIVFNEYEVKPVHIAQLPIKRTMNFEIFESKVMQIVNIKKEDPDTDTSALEKEIDKLVYELYEITKEEIQIIEKE